jgi:hypothetical protein
MSGSGGGQSGDTTVNWNPSMQPRMDNYLNLMERSLFPSGVDNTYQDISQFHKYTDPRFAGPSYNERQAIANTSGMASVAPGGSDHQKAMANNEMALGKTLSNAGNQYDQAQFDRSANLEQNYLNNNLQAQTNNKQLGGNWWEQDQGPGL